MNLESLIEVKNLKKYFPVGQGSFKRIFSKETDFVHAIDDISFAIKKNEIFCLCGESGCGKSTTANILVGLDKPTAGEFIWEGISIPFNELIPKKNDIKSQIIFQNPFSSLNPRMTLGDNVLHSLIIHDKVRYSDTQRRIRNAKYSEMIMVISTIISSFLFIISFLIKGPLANFSALGSIILFSIALILYFYFSWLQKSKILDKTVLEKFNEIGLSPAEQFYFKYPHEVSGGERQRVSIARAIILQPDLLIADEPTSMLDVSCRAGILDLLKSLQKIHGLAILFITHDLATARHFGDQVAIMYVGKLVEKGDVKSLFLKPLHPYTRALIESIPSTSLRKGDFNLPKGEVADAIHPPTGCRFHPRCPIVDYELCSKIEPELIEKQQNHWVACHYPLL
ncbi:ABC transporter ATP-binding protein [Candidatus Hodarchaeum mangrovi]